MTDTALESWLKQATCRLSTASAAQVRAEIQQHYESALEAAAISGTAEEDAARAAVISLGDARTANRGYRKVLLTTNEARLLRQTNWEARGVCARPWLRRALALITAAGFCASAIFISPLILLMAFGLALFCAAAFLPVYTRARGRLFRAVKWIWLIAVFAVAGWPMSRNFAWLFPCMWPIVWNEWTLASVRRKLPVAAWPKQLFL